MGQMIVDQVVQLLSTGGIRAEAAFPPDKLIRITDAVAAVSLEKTQPKEYTTVVLVEILAPQERGGYLCQQKALEACLLLEAGGGVCEQGRCTFLRNANAFRVPVRVTFRSAARPAMTEEIPNPVMIAGGMILTYVCAFSAEQTQSIEGTSETAPWEITLEEFFPWSVWNTLEPQEPFTLDLRHMGNIERYQNCTWKKCRRIKEELGIRQIRTGTAQSRVLTAE